jgi:asparagine synthase (glutamine-hydrolysing)
MPNEDESCWLVFNGEIYNFQELRDKVEARGHRFRSRTDSEVILHLYEDQGIDCLQHIHGMFAFALWDGLHRRLFAARDRIGKKPFYYTWRDGRLLFASELKALLEHPAVERDIDPRSLAKYLAYDCVPAPWTIFKGIEKLLPGHYLVADTSGVRTAPYWSPPQPPAPGDVEVAEGEVAERLRHLLEGAVNRRLVSDVPLGVFLSGGIDSSTIVALVAKRHPGRPIRTFSVGFEDKSFDESTYARHVAQLFGTEHHEAILKPEAMLEILPRVMEHLDEPFADASVIPTYLLSGFARQFVTVVLGGDGGDELFFGYPTFQAERVARWLEWLPAGVFRALRRGVADRLPVSMDNFSTDFKVKRFLMGMEHPSNIRHPMWLSSFDFHGLRAILPTFDREAADSLFQEWEELPSGWSRPERWDAIGYGYLRCYLQDCVLSKVDRASMAHGLEVRAPFLDTEVVEMVYGLPWTLKLRRWTTKHLLKRTMAGLLPAEIVHRPKKGFGIPVAKWLRGPLRSLATDLLAPDRLRRAGIFRPEEVQRLLDEHLRGRVDHRKPLWTLLAFELWRERYGR